MTKLNEGLKHKHSGLLGMTNSWRFAAFILALTVVSVSLVLFVYAGNITSASVTPATLTAGATSTATVAFTTASEIPANGTIQVTFPTGYNVSAVAIGSGSCTGMTGTFNTTRDISPRIVTIARQSNGETTAAGAQTCTITNIQNPQVSGTTGTYTLITTDGSLTSIDNGTASGTAITAGALTVTNVEPASLVAGASSTVTVTFTTTNPIPATGNINVTFPSGFTVSGAGT
ncbi:MAG: hypothetical protein HY832_01795, partial [Candidatus Aenigmarchaeota archaeon]|nr:hypothetical protein [Candidatus Aenigmarchaeota archaeon]